MKKTQRQHLKENELAIMAASARETYAQRKGQIVPLVIVVVVLSLIHI